MSATWTNRGRAFLLALAAVGLTFASCSDTKDDSGPALETLFEQVRTDASRVAELSAGLAISTLSTQGESADGRSRK
jgi:hypothetical protein